MRRTAWAILAAFVAGLGAPPVWAATAPLPPAGEIIGRTPPRLSLAEGEVSFWRRGATDWATARVNTALAPGDELYAGSGANMELQIGARAYVRAGTETHLAVVDQEPDFLRLKVVKGHVALDLRAVPAGHTVEIDTPGATLTTEAPGYYRIEVSGDVSRFVARRGGRARLASSGGETVGLTPGEQVVLDGAGAPRVITGLPPDLDDWDRWNHDRSDRLIEAASARYAPPDVYGLDGLDRHGRWRVVATYGSVWVPDRIEIGWAPYSAGSWMWDAYYGWTWVDDAPWGWAPFHYGRWVNLDGLWAWAPGPLVARPIYSPALVAFFGGGDVSVGIGIGAPLVSWVALGWGEPIVPWWGPRGFVGRPCWRGWGGPRVVNNVVVEHTTVVNVNDVHVYQNARHRHGVLAVPRERFGRERIARPHLVRADADRLRPIHGALPVHPAPEGKAHAPRHGRRTPESVSKPGADRGHQPPPRLTGVRPREGRGRAPEDRRAPLAETRREPGVPRLQPVGPRLTRSGTPDRKLRREDLEATTRVRIEREVRVPPAAPPRERAREAPYRMARDAAVRPVPPRSVIEPRAEVRREPAPAPAPAASVAVPAPRVVREEMPRVSRRDVPPAHADRQISSLRERLAPRMKLAPSSDDRRRIHGGDAPRPERMRRQPPARHR